MHVASYEHSSQTALENAGVYALKACGKICAGVVLLEGDLGLTRSRHGAWLNLYSGFGDEVVEDTAVEASAKREIGVYLTLAQNLMAVSPIALLELAVRVLTLLVP